MCVSTGDQWEVTFLKQGSMQPKISVILLEVTQLGLHTTVNLILNHPCVFLQQREPGNLGTVFVEHQSRFICIL